MKCDAVRPTCGHCSKPRVRGVQAGQVPEECSWDAPRPATTVNDRAGTGSGDEEVMGHGINGSGPSGSGHRGGGGGRKEGSPGDKNDKAGEGGTARKGKRARLDELEERLGEFRPGLC